MPGIRHRAVERGPQPRATARSRGRERLAGYAAGALVVAIWTAFVIVSRAGALGPLMPTDIAGLRMSVALCIAAPIALRFGLAGLSFARASVLVATAGLGFPLLAYSGFAFAPAAHASILMSGTLPLWTALLARLFLGQELTARRLASLGLLVLGILALASGLEEAPEGAWRGDLLFLAASFSWAVFTIAARAWNVPAVPTAGIVGVGAGLFYLPLWIALMPKGLAEVDLVELAAHGLYHGLLAFFVAFVAYTRCLALLGPGPTTMLTAIVPGLGAVLAAPLLDEPLTVSALLGLAFVTAGMVTTIAAANPNRARSEDRAG
ncbi:MAG: DMT family transporter [Geminicoccaceae bacterium]|nr:DMT family transporter [Geminicoccaceae bacterium]MCS7269062.1 DMT family transporter [Geminicoccaceae bacterium]MCX7629109.1 DMT family transporter [Geminicoccaceae bacterium]MDW8124879.1 DMT family transporter [Geminicoccaceae bacterium]MDW8342398.1 DMT family transporter [Geminicoccaceae bacterium]